MELSYRGCSLECLSLGPDGGADHAAIDGLHVGDLADDHGPVLFLGGRCVDWVAQKQHLSKVGELRALRNFFPVLDLVVGHVEGGQFLERGQVVKSFNLVVGKPELLKGGCNVLQVLNSLDVVSGEGQNFEVLQALHGHDLNDGVSAQGQFLTVLKLVDLVV